MRWSVLLLSLVFLIATNRSISTAHEIRVHKNLTRRAIEYLVQQEPTLASISLFADELLFGVAAEDDHPRYFFHFMPAITTARTGQRNAASCDVLEWGFGDQVCIAEAFFQGRDFFLRNDNRWQDAISLGTTRAGFRKLGFVLHLLQDLTSPPHTRFDPHPELAGDADPFEKVAERDNGCASPGECIPTENLFHAFVPQQLFRTLQAITVSNFYSKDSIRDAVDIFTPSSNCDINTFDSTTCGPRAVKEQDGYLLDSVDRRIAWKGPVEPAIDDAVAREQFEELAPLAVQYSAALIKLFVDTVATSCFIRVPADQPTIQAGIDAASLGCTILVSPGTYRESLTITKWPVPIS